MIIPTRLLKSAAKGDLPLHQAAAELMNADDSNDDLGLVKNILTAGKRTAILALQAAATEFGETISEEQEILGLLADITIDVYAIESAMLKTEKLMSKRGAESCEIQIAMTRTYANDAAERIAQNVRALNAAFSAPIPDAGFHQAINTIALRRQIAASVLEAGKYIL